MTLTERKFPNLAPLPKAMVFRCNNTSIQNRAAMQKNHFLALSFQQASLIVLKIFSKNHCFWFFQKPPNNQAHKCKYESGNIGFRLACRNLQALLRFCQKARHNGLFLKNPNNILMKNFGVLNQLHNLLPNASNCFLKTKIDGFCQTLTMEKLQAFYYSFCKSN